MYRERRKRLTLMPAVALAALGALVTVPTLSAAGLYAAPPQRFDSVRVRPGDSLWRIAEQYTADGADVQETIDQIVATNHLSGATIVPGENLKIPR